ncbi:hypothetical protein DB32_008425 [Sandaracinus amylolyticus]|uniref:Nucleotidyltransferase domain-containing protein n=1 Tax=Sandaracinus amylolyticus TaxID=927083 RepID=A0A0F6YND0_9BACT|nr:hypothetical protein DB32_008425 [Sandaracinus amylolyticus]
MLLTQMVSRLTKALGPKLESVVLYGPEAHGDTYREVSPLHLMIVLVDLEPATLSLLNDPVHWWIAQEQPWPRFFTRALIRDSLDVFPIELFDIQRHHRVLHGSDPVVGLEIDRAHMRIQCERELREKLMRLREGFVESRGASKPLRHLLAASYVSFAPVWRGCLHLLGEPVPVHDGEVVRALCAKLGLDVASFDEVARIASEAASSLDASAVYGRYHREIAEMVARIDQLVIGAGGEAR